MHPRPVLKGEGLPDGAARDSQGLREGERIGIAARGSAQSCPMHEGTDGEVREEQAPDFLLNQLRRHALEHVAGVLELGLELIEVGLNGLITNGKFCLTRSAQLRLSWRRAGGEGSGGGRLNCRGFG